MTSAPQSRRTQIAVGVGALGVLASAVAAGTTSADAIPSVRDLRTVTATPSADAGQAARSLEKRASYKGQTFTPGAALKDKANGEEHVRMQRKINGVPVRGGDVVAHLDADGAIESVTDNSGTIKAIATEPSVSVPSAEDAVRSALPSAKVSESKPQLVVDATGEKPVLAYEVTTTGVQKDGTPSRKINTIDAKTGKVISSIEQIKTVEGQGRSLYSGTVGLSTTSGSGGYQLTDPNRGNNNTIDVRNGTDASTCLQYNIGCVSGPVFTDADNTWGTGSNSDRASAAVDAQYGTAMTWDFFKKNYGRNGIWNDGRGSTNRVHYGKNYVNAFWDGRRMTYGDGDGVNYGPLTSLDVAAHEMTHGVTENTANLNYTGESGGLNEATSDVFGTGVEFFANNATDKGDYLIGERFDLRNKTGMRRMDNPASDGKSANCWSSSVGQLNVHYSSGVGNHAFYLMAMGSGAKSLNGVNYNSPTCDGSSVAAIGLTPALNIWYRALSVYMTSTTNYAQARSAMIKASTDLYGANSAQTTGVQAAWKAVNVK